MFQFTGNVGKDAEVKTVGDKRVVEYSVAVSAGKDKEGNWQTLWVNCAKWVSGSQTIAEWEMPKKGDLVLIDAKPNPIRVYTTNAGAQGANLEVLVNRLETLKKSTESLVAGADPVPYAAKVTTPKSFAPLEASDDLPF